MKKILFIDSKLNTKVYNTIQEAADENNLLKYKVMLAMQGCGKTEAGFFINYKTQSNKKLVVQIDVETENIVGIYDNVREAVIKSKISTILKCLNSKIKTAGGYYWKYIDLCVDNAYKINRVKARLQHLEKKEKILLYNIKADDVTCYNSIIEASLDTLLSIEEIRESVFSNKETEIGFFTQYNTRRHSMPVLQIDTHDMSIVSLYSSVYDAKMKTGIVNIADCAKGKAKSAGGYCWKFLNLIK